MKREARRVSRFVSAQTWALRESTLDVIVEVLRMRAAGITLSKEEVQARIGAGPSSQAVTMRGSVAVLPLSGVIAPKMNAMTEISGGTSLDVWMQRFREYRDEASVSAIVLDVDSPGGSVFGVIEAADEIFRARAIKPIIAQVNPECGSAALWLAAMATEVVCTPSGAVGSLGCFCIHEDWSKANEMMGVKPTYVSYGDYKVEGNPDAPLSDEAYAHLKSQVDAVGESFTKSVAKGRGVNVKKVKAEFGKGRMLLAADALGVGLIDRIATLDDTIARMTGGSRRRSMAAVSGEPILSEAAKVYIGEAVAAQLEAIAPDVTEDDATADPGSRASLDLQQAAERAQADADLTATTLALVR